MRFLEHAGYEGQIQDIIGFLNSISISYLYLKCICCIYNIHNQKGHILVLFNVFFSPKCFERISDQAQTCQPTSNFVGF